MTTYEINVWRDKRVIEKVVRQFENDDAVTDYIKKRWDSGGDLPRLDPEKGYLRPKVKDDIITWTGPLLAGRMLIVSGSHGIVAAISPYSGKFLGAINVKSSINTQAIVADETVYFITSDGYLLAYR